MCGTYFKYTCVEGFIQYEKCIITYVHNEYFSQLYENIKEYECVAFCNDIYLESFLNEEIIVSLEDVHDSIHIILHEEY